MRTCITRASTITDSSMVTAMPPSIASVVAALRLFGLRKAGTPLLMASTPVRAAHPEEKARSSRNAPASVARPPSYCDAPSTVNLALSATGRSPKKYRANPHSPMPMIDAMNT